MDTENVKSEKTIPQRHEELKIALQNGDITKLNVMPSLCVQDAFTKNGVAYEAINYTPCFTYVDKNGKQFVEDIPVLGIQHQVIRTLFEYCYMNLSITDIK